MDLVALLLTVAWGHNYILVIIDYATQYLEAITLCKAPSESIARELVLLFN